MELTSDLAWSISKDAGNVAMREGGRKAWNQADYNEAVKTFNRLWPIERDKDALK